jgi:hypothetical protein
MLSLTPFQTFKLGTPLCRKGYTCFIFSIARENNLISFSLKYKTAFFLKGQREAPCTLYHLFVYILKVIPGSCS